MTKQESKRIAKLKAGVKSAKAIVQREHKAMMEILATGVSWGFIMPQEKRMRKAWEYLNEVSADLSAAEWEANPDQLS